MIKLIGETLRQWEKGRSVEISLPDGVDVRELIFEKAGMKQSVSVVDGVANIPDFMLMRYGILSVVLKGVDDEGRLRKETMSFNVKKEHKPEDYTEPSVVASSGGVSASEVAAMINEALGGVENGSY